MSSGFVTIYAPSVLALSIVLPVLDIMAVGLRLYARRKHNLNLGVDDYLCILALVFTLACAATLIAGTALQAVGYPTPNVNLSDGTATSVVNRAIQITSQVEWAIDLLSVVTLGLIKLSFLFFLRQVFCNRVQDNTVFSKILSILIVTVCAWTIAFFLTWLFVCKGDFAARWGPYLELRQKCLRGYLLLYATAVTDVILDGIVVLLPLPIILRLKLSVRKKLAITGVFMIGLIVVAVSLARLILIIKLSSSDPSTYEDLYITQYVWWTMCEVGMALLASCLTNLRPLIPEATGHGFLESLMAPDSQVSLSRPRRNMFEDVAAKPAEEFSMHRIQTSAHNVADTEAGLIQLGPK